MSSSAVTTFAPSYHTPATATSYTMHDKSDPSTASNHGNDTVSNVSRLKNMFQVDDAAGAGGRYKAALGGRYSNDRSPDIKRKRSNAEYAADAQRQAKQRSPELIDPNTLDPQDLFATTNHVQRVQYTRSLFAKMEQQNMAADVRRASRSKSPASSVGQRTVSPSPARSPSYDRPHLMSPEPPEYKSRTQSESNRDKPGNRSVASTAAGAGSNDFRWVVRGLVHSLLAHNIESTLVLCQSG